jgi:uncharacterized membrane protein YfcA
LDIQLTIQVLVLLFFAAAVAGFLDTLVGGGGLITIPALLMAGVPPIYALGTNKLQAVSGSGTATLMMLIRGRIEFFNVRWLMLSAFIGSIVGTIAVQYFDTELLKVLIPAVIVVIALYFIFSPTKMLAARTPRISKQKYGATAVPSIGFYDGMFGPGTGSFFVLAGVSLRGQEIVDATANAKALNFATNLASLLIFIAYGKLLWMVGAVMILGQIIGANLGARTLLLINPLILRYLVIGMCLFMLGSWMVSEL